MTTATLTTHAVALDLYDKGICVVRTHTDGKKRPLGAWQQYQTQRPTRAEVDAWFATGHPGLGMICGSVSGEHEMFELEGRFIREQGFATFIAAMERAGLRGLIERLMDGFSVASPSGGLHLHYRVVDGKAEPNTKLASRPSTPEELAVNPKALVQVLIETRGEGGFSMLPPSGGTCHPSGRPWVETSVSTRVPAAITVAERAALWRVAASFDVAPPPTTTTTHAPPVSMPSLNGSRPAAADERPGDWFNRNADFGTMLAGDGWTFAGLDPAGDELWARPGKPIKDGHSAVLHLDGTPVLAYWSTSLPAAMLSEARRAPGSKVPTWRCDAFGYLAAMHFNNDIEAAATFVRQRYMGGGSADAGLHVPTLLPPARRPAVTTASILDDQFWTARPVLAHVRQAAHARYRSAEAFLGVVLARLAASVHPSLQLAPTVGAAASLSTYVAIVGPSGSGKSSTVRAVADLLPITSKEVADNLPLGSGEGLMEVYYDMVSEDGPNGKPIMVKRRVRHGAFMFLDEGEALAKMGADRAGSTIMPVLRSAWTGATVGTTNAKTETKRLLEAGTYALGFVIGFQPEIAGPLLDDHIGGTPQRFLWLSNVDPTIPKVAPPWPGPLRWTHPPLMRLGDRPSARYIEAPASVVALLTEHAHAVGTGAKVPDALDSHAHLVRLKVAGLLAVLDGRTVMDDEDWSLAEAIVAASDAVRGGVLEAVAAERRGKAHASRVGYAERELMVDEARHQRQVHRVARNIARFVHANGETSRSEVRRNAVDSKDRTVFEDALDEAVSKGWVVRVDDRLAPGGSQPA